jgi:hypothetical protein
MSQNPLITYLNDHLAGGNAALEMLERLIEYMHGAKEEPELREILREIEEDKSVLVGILHKAGGKESRVRSAAAFLAEKLGQAKMALDDPGGGEFRNFQALEALALGIQGKAALWRALGEASRNEPTLNGDYVALERRAQNQFQRVDGLRLRLARAALSS